MEYNGFETWGERRKMKVFISWSGKTSFEVAKVLKEWIPCVIQDIEPYFSSDDIDKGARWSTDIAKELEAAEFGILCVTKDNLNSAWLNFEAGALSKAIDKSKVCPFLFNLLPSEISNSPILQFQMTSVDRDDMYKLFQSMNKALGEKRLNRVVIENVDFERLIKTYDRESALFYCDPPYYDAEKYYPDKFQSEDHARLRDALSRIKGKFILSYNDCQEIRDLYAGYDLIEVDRQDNLVTKTNPRRYRELIIKNY